MFYGGEKAVRALPKERRRAGSVRRIFPFVFLLFSCAHVYTGAPSSGAEGAEREVFEVAGSKPPVWIAYKRQASADAGGLVIREYRLAGGKSVFVSRQSFGEGKPNRIRIWTRGFSEELNETRETPNDLRAAACGDLNGDGFPEFYLRLESPGALKRSFLEGFSSNNNLSMTEIYRRPVSFVPAKDARRDGVLSPGRDRFEFRGRELVYRVSFYRKGDQADRPSGGTFEQAYVLRPGEAGWLLVPREESPGSR